MNFINEHAVAHFLRGKMKFYGISDIIEKAFGIYKVENADKLESIRDAEEWAREFLTKEGL
jgi:1-deoxy-D-xylulose 5-phosphate reductoisomerase